MHVFYKEINSQALKLCPVSSIYILYGTQLEFSYAKKLGHDYWTLARELNVL